MIEMGLTETTGSNESNIHCPSTKEIGNLFLPVVMSIEMVVGLPLNTIALWIFCFRMKFWKAHALFLFNLVLADFLLIISVPFRIDTHLRHENWVFGQVWCRINHFMLTVNRSASIAFMTVVALHRYFKVVHPHNCISHMTKTQAIWLTGLIWTSITALSIPLLITNLLNKHGNVTACRSFDSYKVVPPTLQIHYMAFFAEFVLPWFLLLFCSVRITCFLYQRQMNRQKKVRKAILTVIVISLVFTVCFMPGVITGFAAMLVRAFRPDDCPNYIFFTQCFKVCIAFTYLNSTLDPVIYCFSSSMFRDAIRNSISRLCFGKAFTSVSSVGDNS